MFPLLVTGCKTAFLFFVYFCVNHSCSFFLQVIINNVNFKTLTDNFNALSTNFLTLMTNFNTLTATVTALQTEVATLKANDGGGGGTAAVKIIIVE